MRSSERSNYTLKLWLQYYLWSGYGKVFLAAEIAAVLSAFAYWWTGSNDPFFAREFGGGWECDATRGGARICAKDVHPPPKRPDRP